jgi:hypothetical protein
MQCVGSLLRQEISACQIEHLRTISNTVRWGDESVSKKQILGIIVSISLLCIVLSSLLIRA